MRQAAATLVDAGAFRVDRKRALDKLMKFQLPDPRLFVLAWVQAAVAGKAGRIEVGEGADGLFLRCDGQPWAEADMRDPYSAFFNRAPGWRGARAAAFAVGLLSAFRLEPREIILKSGRLQLRMRGVNEEESSPLEKAVDGTRIDVIGVSGVDVESLAGRCSWCPAEVALMGKPVPRRATQGPFLDFKAEGKSGRVWLDASDRPASSLELVVNGVTAAEHEAALPLVQVGAVLRDDGLRLSLSTTKVVQDARLRRGVALVGRQARLLIERSIAEARRDAPEVGRQMLADGAKQWLAWESFLGGWLAGDGAGEAEARTRRVALIVSALRKACLARRDDLTGAKRGLADRLWGAPIAFDAQGKPMTLSQVESLRRAIGHVPYTDRSRPVPIANGNAVWAPRGGDLKFLTAFFPEQARPVRSGWSEDRVDTVTVLGDRRLIDRSFEYEGFTGRIALSSTARKGSGRVRWLLRGRTPVTTDIDLGSLRVDAMLEREGLVWPPDPGNPLYERCRAGLMQLAPLLYRELSAGFRPQDQTYVQAAIREHLLDLLATDWDVPSQAPRGQRWLDDVPLFLDERLQALSLSALQGMARGGLRPVLFSPSQFPQFVSAARGRPDHVRKLLGDAVWLGGVRKPKAVQQAAETAAPALDPKAEASRLERLELTGLQGRLEELRAVLRGLIPASGGALDAKLVDGLQFRRGNPSSTSAMTAEVRGGWAIFFNHPLVGRLLELPDRDGAHAALASIVFSALNREDARVSDMQDIDFQTALAGIAEREGRPREYLARQRIIGRSCVPYRCRPGSRRICSLVLIMFKASAVLALLAASGAAAQDSFLIEEGNNVNLLYRDAEVAAHVVVTAKGGRPRIAVAFPAANSGAGLWFEGAGAPTRGAEAAVWFSSPSALRKSGPGGVAFDVSSPLPELRLGAVLLDSVRALRDFGHGAFDARGNALREARRIIAALPEAERSRLEAAGVTTRGIDDWLAAPARELAGGGWEWSRRALGSGAEYRLALSPAEGTRIERDGQGFRLSASSAALGFTVTASVGLPPLSPLGLESVLNEAGRACVAKGGPRLAEAGRNLAFLSYREKFLAGSWQYLTYFGRDTLLSARVLSPVLTVDALEAGLGSVLERLSPEGEVAHEEDLGDQAALGRLRELAARGRPESDTLPIDRPAYDYKMIDGEFLLPLLAAEYSDHADDQRLREFLGRGAAAPTRGAAAPTRGEGAPTRGAAEGGTHADALARAFDRLLSLTEPYADARERGESGPALARRLVSLKPGRRVGDWRDSEEGLGGGRFPSSVNAGLAAAALRASAKLLLRAARLGVEPARGALQAHGGSSGAQRVAAAWDHAWEHFRVALTVDEARERLKRYLEGGMPAPEREALERADLGGATVGDFVSGRKVPAVLEGGLAFWALSLEEDGSPIPVQSSDVSFALDAAALEPAWAREAAAVLALPFPVGLASPVGTLVANPAFSTRPGDYERFGRDRYHGAVVWSWPMALARRGLARQLSALAPGDPGRGPLERALAVTRAGEEAVGGLRASELWTWTIEEGAMRPAAFGAGATDATESNAIQLWSTLNLAGCDHSPPLRGGE